MAIQLPVRNMAGQQVGTIDLDERVFGAKRNDTLIHQVVVAQQANKRRGTASTKTRGDMDWGGAKPYRQKGTGRARQGSRTAPHYKGGGVVWGPHPRSYRQATPKKMRRGALRSLLSAKVADNQLLVLDELRFDEPKTKAMYGVLNALGVDNALVVLTDNCVNVRRSADNIPKIDTTRADSLNVLDVITRQVLIMPVEAVRMVEQNLVDDHRRVSRLALAAGVPEALVRVAAPPPSTVDLAPVAMAAAAAGAVATAAAPPAAAEPAEDEASAGGAETEPLAEADEPFADALTAGGEVADEAEKPEDDA